MKQVVFKYSYYIILLMFIGFAATAQKLPNVQQGGLRVPANVKIDGKPAELNNRFEAYNHATDVFYTMANDDNNLYLTIQATDNQIISKIMAGGITFTVNPSGKKTDKNSMAITYPLFDSKDKPTIATAKALAVVQNAPVTPKQMDSLVSVSNKKVSLAKQIRVVGIKNIDTLISVYNEDGIKAAGGIDAQMAYTYELSVSLKHLNLSVNQPVMFAYNIRLNEVEEKGINVLKDDSGNIMSVSVVKGAQRGQPATDFWGEYTLVKK